MVGNCGVQSFLVSSTNELLPETWDVWETLWWKVYAAGMIGAVSGQEWTVWTPEELTFLSCGKLGGSPPNLRLNSGVPGSYN